MVADSQYSDGVIQGMQMLYGEGFLSPGGPDEVGQLLNGVDPAGMRVLDMGSGLGGCAIMLVRDFGAGHVTGIDIEPDLVARAASAVGDAGLHERIAFQTVEPGPLPQADQTFDLVVTKDVICHVPDKVSVLTEICRVLKPGGAYLCADFFDASGNQATNDDAKGFYQAYVDGMKAYGLSFYFEPQSVYENALASAGLELFDLRDHTAISANTERSFLASDQAGAVKFALGDDRFQARCKATTMRHKALETRGLLHGHIHARKR
ncbi:MAG: class I SAM-dependent methyltransferase [Rhodospirillales bacterium]|nr:class I SAM-dependent methyltransferase [Rhodospirillales bacterium]